MRPGRPVGPGKAHGQGEACLYVMAASPLLDVDDTVGASIVLTRRRNVAERSVACWSSAALSGDS